MTNETVATLARCGSANVSDALRSMGKHFQAMDGGIRPVDDAFCAVGPAYTVRCYPGATYALEQALESAAEGDVLVVDGGSHPDVILMGGLMSRRAQQRGLAGAVLDAAVRDIDEIREMRFPVFSRHICPRAGTFAQIGETQTTICCGRLPVTPGDWVVADASGVTVIPQKMLYEVVAAASLIHQREAAIRRLLIAGATLGDAAAESQTLISAADAAPLRQPCQAGE